MLISLRLRAFYETSRRTLFILLFIWAASFLTSIVLLGENFFRYIDGKSRTYSTCKFADGAG